MTTTPNKRDLLLERLARLQVVIVALLVLLVLFHLPPRDVRRQIRLKMANLIMWQWIKGSKYSAVLYNWLWNQGNGKKDHQETR